MSVWRKLGEIAEFVNGRAFKPDEWEESGVPIIRIQNLNDESKSFNYTTKKLPDTFKVNTGDILFSWSGTPGTSFGCFRWSRETGWLNQHIFNVKFKNDNIFSDYFIRSVNSQLGKIIDQAHGGVGLKHITKKKLLEIEIPLPSLPEQKRIAAILDAADALRNQRRQSITELDLLLQSTFLEMFGDPVENPKGWDVGCIGDLLESASYGTSKKANDGDGEYPILRMNNITYSGGWNFSSLKYIDFDEKEKKKYLVNKGDILFNRTNSKELVGKTAVYRRSEPMAFAGYLVKGIPSSNANSEYIGGFMNLPQTKLLLQNMCKSIIGMANINAKEFQAIAIPKPPIELQEKFAEIVEGIEGQKARLQAHLTELDTLFASLQQRAFNGEL